MRTLRRLRWLSGVLLWALALAAQASVLVLVPGYLEGGDSWRDTGVAAGLSRAGWADGGHLRSGPQGVRVSGARARAMRTFYTVDLPAEAPLLVQAGFLKAYLDAVRQHHPDERLLLAGHSAGGVVARLTMVQHPDIGVSSLITLASPHLGTQSAEVGSLAGQSPLAMLAPMLGGDTLNRSQALYQDLARERPNSLLYWLNRQPHPSADYISIVRRDDSLLGLGDLVVPAGSQDMRNVPALRGRARSLQVSGGHGLEQADGALLARLLASLELEHAQENTADARSH